MGSGKPQADDAVSSSAAATAAAYRRKKKPRLQDAESRLAALKAENETLKRHLANITDKTGRSENEARQSLASFSPMKRLITPGEVASLVAYLTGDAAASITGAALPLDGGETA